MPSSDNSQELANEIAVVTGSAQGIGAAIARKFGQHGAKVALVDLQVDKAQSVADEINSNNGTARAFFADISRPDTLVTLRDQIHDAFGPVSVLVNNAARIPFQDFLSVSWDDWDQTIRTNLSGTFYCSRIFIDDMLALRRGNIIIISSVNGIQAQIGLSAYNVTKAGLIMLTQTMALELARYNIRVNAIAPGDIATSVVENVDDEEAALANIPLHRWGRPEEIAEAALFLASSRASYATGSVLVCDGGLSAQLYPS